jgi:hypothetical protein
MNCHFNIQKKILKTKNILFLDLNLKMVENFDKRPTIKPCENTTLLIQKKGYSFSFLENS